MKSGRNDLLLREMGKKNISYSKTEFVIIIIFVVDRDTPCIPMIFDLIRLISPAHVQPNNTHALVNLDGFKHTTWGGNPCLIPMNQHPSRY